MLDVSIIIVNWNTRSLLLDCIESIIAETRDHSYEIIVVDNASTDGSQQAVRERFGGVRLVENEANLGFAKANNIGVSMARGAFVCLVNSDIKILDGCIDRMVDQMASDNSIGLLGPKTLDKFLRQRFNCRNFPTLRNTLCEACGLDQVPVLRRVFRGRLIREGLNDGPKEVDVLSGCLLLIRREAIEQAGPLDERFFIYGEDKDLCRRFRNHGWKAVFLPDAQAIHYGGASSAVAPLRYLVEKCKSDFIYWDIHHTAREARQYRVVTAIHFGLRTSVFFVLKSVVRSGGGNFETKYTGFRDCLKWTIRNFSVPGVACKSMS